MMKTTTYIKEFDSEAQADEWMRMKNRTARAAGNRKDIFCLVDGPRDNFAVVDLATAIDLGIPYKWSDI